MLDNWLNSRRIRMNVWSSRGFSKAITFLLSKVWELVRVNIVINQICWI
jgi:hypothetical protein